MRPRALRRRPWIAAALGLSLAAAALPGFAASLGGLWSRTLGAGSATVAACDSNGFTASYTVVSGNVTAVTVDGIADPACEGGQLSVTLTHSGTDIGSGGPQTVPTDGDVANNAMTVALSPQPAADQVNSIHIAITGP